MEQPEIESRIKIDNLRIKEAYDFFKEAFIIMTDHDAFEDTEFRLKWTAHLNYFQNFSNKTVEKELRK